MILKKLVNTIITIQLLCLTPQGYAVEKNYIEPDKAKHRTLYDLLRKDLEINQTRYFSKEELEKKTILAEQEVSNEEIANIKNELKDSSYSTISIKHKLKKLMLKESENHIIEMKFMPVSYTHLTLPTTPYV